MELQFQKFLKLLQSVFQNPSLSPSLQRIRNHQRFAKTNPSHPRAKTTASRTSASVIHIKKFQKFLKLLQSVFQNPSLSPSLQRILQSNQKIRNHPRSAKRTRFIRVPKLRLREPQPPLSTSKNFKNFSNYPNLCSKNLMKWS